jgi:hypothetical protein
VGDGEDISIRVIVRFDIIWKSGATETTVASTSDTFDPTNNGTVGLDADLAGAAVNPLPGDQLILRFSTTGGDSGASYTPNGDGTAVGGRVPNLTLPH